MEPNTRRRLVVGTVLVLLVALVLVWVVLTFRRISFLLG